MNLCKDYNNIQLILYEFYKIENIYIGNKLFILQRSVNDIFTNIKNKFNEYSNLQLEPFELQNVTDLIKRYNILLILDNLFNLLNLNENIYNSIKNSNNIKNLINTLSNFVDLSVVNINSIKTSRLKRSLFSKLNLKYEADIYMKRVITNLNKFYIDIIENYIENNILSQNLNLYSVIMNIQTKKYNNFGQLNIIDQQLYDNIVYYKTEYEDIIKNQFEKLITDFNPETELNENNLYDSYTRFNNLYRNLHSHFNILIDDICIYVTNIYNCKNERSNYSNFIINDVLPLEKNGIRIFQCSDYGYGSGSGSCSGNPK